MTTIQYQYFPKNQLLPEILRQVVDIFIAQEHLISSQTNLLHSNDILHILSEPLMALGFKVEVSKRLEDKIRIPVLFGRNGKMEKFKIVNIMLIIVLIINVVLPVISAATNENKEVNSVEEIKKDKNRIKNTGPSAIRLRGLFLFASKITKIGPLMRKNRQKYVKFRLNGLHEELHRDCRTLPAFGFGLKCHTATLVPNP